MESFITRSKRGSSFVYLKKEKRVDATLAKYIDTLAIPPAWKNVRVSSSRRAKVLATGTDSSGKTQAIYNPTFRKAQERKKFDRVLRFAESLPALRRQVERDLRKRKFTKDKVAAAAVSLIDQTYFRVGNPGSAKQQHYGVSTFRSKHISHSSTGVTFDFVGKSGKAHHRTIKDNKLAKIIRALDEQPGYTLFRYEENGSYHDLSAGDINDYIKRYASDEFTAKDFRTWGGTLHAVAELVAEEYANDETARKKRIVSSVKAVAKRLGNTPAVTKSSYIDPRIIAAYEAGDTLHKIKKTVSKMKPRKYLSHEEQCLLTFLKRYS